MSSKYGFESPEQKQRRLEQERRRLEQEAREREREQGEEVARRQAIARQDAAIVRDILADYARVNGFNLDDTLMSSRSLSPRFEVTDKYGSTEFTVRVGPGIIEVVSDHAGTSDVRQVAKVLHEQTGTPSELVKSKRIPGAFHSGGQAGGAEWTEPDRIEREVKERFDK